MVRSSTDEVQQTVPAFIEALAFAAAFALSVRTRVRKSAIKVRGGRARARSARRDARGRFEANKKTAFSSC